MALVYIDKVPTDRVNFESKVRAIATKYGFDPNWLMIIMYFETAGKFLPGYYKTSNAVGLIQFTTLGAAQVGTNKDFLSKLTAVQQLDYVDRYFGSFGITGKITNLTDCYLVVFAPAFISKPSGSIVYKSGTQAYSGNAALDIGKKGYITVGDIGTVINRYRNGYVDGLGSVTQLAGMNGAGTLLLALVVGGMYLKKRNQKTNG